VYVITILQIFDDQYNRLKDFPAVQKIFGLVEKKQTEYINIQYISYIVQIYRK